MRSFLGLVNFCRDFIPSLAHYTKSLSSCLCKVISRILYGHKKWLMISITLFLQSQIMCLLLFPLWMMYFASLVMPLLGVWGCGVVYCVHEGMGRRCRWPTTAGAGGLLQQAPVAYYSRQTRPREEKYSASELECLALVESLQHFKAYLIGQRFKVYTDHNALKSLLTSTSLNSRDCGDGC